MKKQVFLSIILLSCFFFKDAFCKEIELTELKLVGAPVSELPDNEKFFLVYKESLFLDLDLSEVEKYEPIIGSMKTKSKNDLRFADISKIPEAGIKKGDQISFYNTVTKKIEKFEVQENSAFKMIIDPYYPDSNRYYRAFNLVLTNPEKFHQFTHLDSFKIESIAYRGNKFKIKPTVERFEYINFGKNINEREMDDVKELLKAYASKKNVEVTEKSPYISRLASGDKEIITFSFSSTMGSINFYKIDSNRYLTWWNPGFEGVVKEGVEFYADLIEGAELAIIYKAVDRIFLRIIYKDRIENYLVWRTYGVL